MGNARPKRTQKRQRWAILTVATLAAGGLGATLLFSGPDGFSERSVQITPSGDRLETVAAGEMPSFARRATGKVRETYRYAAAHPDVLQYIPCFCGCRNIGHRHNGDCYVQERYDDGRIDFTNHAAT